jgi:hypothetical protein
MRAPAGRRASSLIDGTLLAQDRRQVARQVARRLMRAARLGGLDRRRKGRQGDRLEGRIGASLDAALAWSILCVGPMQRHEIPLQGVPVTAPVTGGMDATARQPCDRGSLRASSEMTPRALTPD